MDSEKKKGLFRSGAGVIAAIVILLLFALTALYLKSLIFGIIAAYFFLPLKNSLNGFSKQPPCAERTHCSAVCFPRSPGSAGNLPANAFRPKKKNRTPNGTG